MRSSEMCKRFLTEFDRPEVTVDRTVLVDRALKSNY